MNFQLAGLFVIAAVVAVAAGSLRSQRQLPRHRVPHLRVRLRLRLRPGVARHGVGVVAALGRWAGLGIPRHRRFQHSGRTGIHEHRGLKGRYKGRPNTHVRGRRPTAESRYRQS